MQYMLLIYGDESAERKVTETQMAQTIAAYGAYTAALREAGVLVASDRLKPIATATTVHVAGGKTEVLNGPYAETKEQLGGFYQIEVLSLPTRGSLTTSPIGPRAQACSRPLAQSKIPMPPTSARAASSATKRCGSSCSGNASRLPFARDHGVRLLPQVYEAYNPMAYDAAKAMEVELGIALRNKGFGVWQA